MEWPLGKEAWPGTAMGGSRAGHSSDGRGRAYNSFVRGFRGNTETEQDIVNRVESDIEYIDTWTPALDIQIIVRTAATFLFQAGAY